MRRWLVVAHTVVAALLLWTPSASAAGATVNVSPSTALTDGASVTVTGNGFTAGFGAITECNNDPSQPTVLVALANIQVPVGCTNPVSALVTIDGAGNVPSTKFTVHTGTVGPPDPGVDSAGHPAATDAANFPCPPTVAQINKGVTCVIGVGDTAQHQATFAITFQGQAVPTTSTSTTAAPTTTTAPASTTTTAGTGATTTTVAPGTATTLPVGGVRATTTTTLAASVLGTQVTNSGSALPRTGLPQHLGLIGLVGVVALDIGWLLQSSTHPARRRLRRRSGVMRRS